MDNVNGEWGHGDVYSLFWTRRLSGLADWSENVTFIIDWLCDTDGRWWNNK